MEKNYTKKLKFRKIATLIQRLTLPICRLKL